MSFGGGEKTRFSLSGLFTRLAGSFDKGAIHALTPNSLSSATSLGLPVLSQNHALTPLNLISATSLDNPTLSIVADSEGFESRLSIAIAVGL